MKTSAPHRLRQVAAILVNNDSVSNPVVLTVLSVLSFPFPVPEPSLSSFPVSRIQV